VGRSEDRVVQRSRRLSWSELCNTGENLCALQQKWRLRTRKYFPVMTVKS
jgi:hypothetical protein